MLLEQEEQEIKQETNASETEEQTGNKTVIVFLKKIVRDNASEELAKHGVEIKYKELSKTRLKFALLRKLSEESYECLKTRSTEDLIEELCDVLLVFITICNLNGISLKEISLSLKKRNLNTEKATLDEKRKATDELKKKLVEASKDCILVAGENVSKKLLKEKLVEFFSNFLLLLDAAEISLARIARKHNEKKNIRGAFDKSLFISHIKGPEDNFVIKKYFNLGAKKTSYQVKIVKE